MHRKNLLIILIPFFSLQARAQEPQNDSIKIGSSEHNEYLWPIFPNKASFPTQSPALWMRNYNLHEIPSIRNYPFFHKNNRPKTLPNLPKESFSVNLPQYNGLGDFQKFGGTLGSIKLTNKLALDYGAFVNVQYGYSFASRQIVAGTNFLLRYNLTNKLQFQIWRQDIKSEKSTDPTFKLQPFFLTKKIGTGLQYNSSEKTKIKVGIDYHYDPDHKKWKPESGGKVLLNF